MKNLDSDQYTMIKHKLRFVTPKEAFARLLSKEYDIKTIQMVGICDTYLEYKQTYKFFNKLDENYNRLSDVRKGRYDQ